MNFLTLSLYIRERIKVKDFATEAVKIPSPTIISTISHVYKLDWMPKTTEREPLWKTSTRSGIAWQSEVFLKKEYIFVLLNQNKENILFVACIVHKVIISH